MVGPRPASAAGAFLMLETASTPPAPRRYTFDEVWAAEFEPAYREHRRRAAEHRTEAFLDVALDLCGEEVRQMTPHDMLHLDALGNPFIAGAPDGTVHFLDCAGLIWQLHVDNTHTASLANLWRRSRVLRRLASIDIAVVVPAIIAYVDRMLLDPAKAPAPASADSTALSPEPKTHFLAGLLVNLSSDLGHIDPMSGLLLAQTPLPRLLQYSAAIASERQSERIRDEADSLRNRCLARMNDLNAGVASIE